MPKRDEVTGEIVRNMDGTPVMTPVRQRKARVPQGCCRGDTVGDQGYPGPALNILREAQQSSPVFADFFMSINNGQGYFNVPRQVF